MKLTLEHCKNVDLMYGQGNGTGYWEQPVDPRKMIVEVANLAEAQQEFNAWIKRNGLGGGNLTKRAGQVRDGKTIIGTFSYNGRLWAGGKVGTEEIKLDERAAQKVQDLEPAPFTRMERLTLKQAEAFPDIMCNYTDAINADTVAFHRCAATGFYVVETGSGDFHAGIDAYDGCFATLEEAVAFLKEHWLKLYPPAQSKRAMTIHSTEQAFTSVAIVAMKAALEKINECRRKCPGVGGDVDAMNLRSVIAANQPDQHVMAQAVRCLESLAPSLEIQADHEIAALRFAVDVLS